MHRTYGVLSAHVFECMFVYINTMILYMFSWNLVLLLNIMTSIHIIISYLTSLILRRLYIYTVCMSSSMNYLFVFHLGIFCGGFLPNKSIGLFVLFLFHRLLYVTITCPFMLYKMQIFLLVNHSFSIYLWCHHSCRRFSFDVVKFVSFFLHDFLFVFDLRD